MLMNRNIEGLPGESGCASIGYQCSNLISFERINITVRKLQLPTRIRTALARFILVLKHSIALANYRQENSDE